MRYTLTKNISQKEKITNWPKRGLRGWGSVTGKDELTRVSDDSEFERILDEYQLGGTSDKTNFVSPINFYIPGILIEKQNLKKKKTFSSHCLWQPDSWRVGSLKIKNNFFLTSFWQVEQALWMEEESEWLFPSLALCRDVINRSGRELIDPRAHRTSANLADANVMRRRDRLKKIWIFEFLTTNWGSWEEHF